jgi:hypothetical protein
LNKKRIVMANEEKREKDTGIKRHPDPEKDTQQNPKEVPMRDPDKNPGRDPGGDPAKEVKKYKK